MLCFHLGFAWCVCMVFLYDALACHVCMLAYVALCCWSGVFCMVFVCGVLCVVFFVCDVFFSNVVLCV